MHRKTDKDHRSCFGITMMSLFGLCLASSSSMAENQVQLGDFDGVDGHARIAVQQPELGPEPEQLSFTTLFGLEAAPPPSVRLPELDLDEVYQENQRLYDEGYLDTPLCVLTRLNSRCLWCVFMRVDLSYCPLACL